ncbi:alpha/beta-hydrolase family protein [Gordonia sp. LUNF6]|uniref:alpha/beta-hydrolase family protein n=1 Tax=Gordonia sp. LUNF6 TaxID=3388658 RepID=UPI00399A8B4E
MNRLRVRPAVAAGALAGRLLALAPGMLPRSALVAAVAGLALTLLGMAVGAGVGALRDRIGDRPPAPVSGGVLAAGLVVAGAAVGLAARHESAVRAAVGAPPIGPGWVLAVCAIPVAAAAAVVAIPGRVWAGFGMVAVVAAASIGLPAPAQASGPDVPERPVMLYSPLSEPGSVRDRAERLADRWVADGGREARAVVVAVPTGSGWIDAGTVDGFTGYFGGSVRVVALQYDDVASWRAFISSPDRAGTSASAVLDAVWSRISNLPEARRPRVYLAGQSLGAVGADAARRWANDSGVELAGTVLAGPPAGSVDRVASCERRVVLANADDPVPGFAPSLLWHPIDRIPGDGDDRRHSESPPWLPVVSMVGTVLDLAGSLKVPAGHGHRYGVEQGLAAGIMPAGCQPTGPRAAS